MPLITRHPDYTYHERRWRKCLDFARGAWAVKIGARLYLPPLEGQTNPEYDAYLMRAKFYSATSRTVGGLLGALFRKDPEVTDEPASLDDVFKDVTNKGQTFNGFAKDCAADALACGRRGVLIDIPAIPDQTDPRPFLVPYDALQIINWRTDLIEGVRAVTLVVLQESIEVPIGNDQYSGKIIPQWRVLSLRDADPANVTTIANPEYWQAIYQQTSDIAMVDPSRITDPNWKAGQVATADNPFPKSVTVDGKSVNADNAGYVLTYQTKPVRNGKPLPEIPFVFIGSRDTGPDIDPIPIEDLVEVNHAHYLKSAGYNHALWFCGLPTPYAFGQELGVIELVKEEGIDGAPSKMVERRVLKIGSGQAWTGSDPTTKVGFLEFTGQGVAPLKAALDDDKAEMAVLGARLLEEQKDAAEAADTQQMRQNGDASILGTLASSLSDALTKIVVWLAFWTGEDDSDATVEVNTEFFPTPIDALTLQALTASWQAGGISQDTYLFNIQRGGFMPPGVSVEDEADKIEAQQPPGMPKPLPGQPVPPAVPPKPGEPVPPAVPPAPVAPPAKPVVKPAKVPPKKKP